MAKPKLILQLIAPDGARSEKTVEIDGAVTLSFDENGTPVPGRANGVIYGTDADPNGSVFAVRPALYYNDTGGVWVKTGAGNTNTGWESIIAS
jgi:hypothetical protein